MKIKENLTLADFKKMKVLESKFYEDEFITPYEEVYDWYSKFDFSIRIVEDKGQVVGFLNLFPINDDIFNLLKKGEFNDKYLKTSHIVNIENLNSSKHQSGINLFLSCILIDADYRKTNALKLLLEEYSKYYSEVEEKITVNNVITDNVTESGARFSKRLGFDKIVDSNHESEVFMIDFQKFKENIAAL